MSKLTLDDAIKHCLEVAEQNETSAITYKNCKEIKTNMYEKLTAEKAENDCRECAAEHRQLAEWLTELKVLRGKIADICSILAAYYGCPCDHSPQDEIMEERGNCEDCGEISNAECWSRFLETEIQLDREGIQDNTNKMYAEIKDLREENKVLISECDRLIKEKGELLKKSEQIAEYKRLLKDFVSEYDGCKTFPNRDAVLKLIGEDEDENC